MNHKKIIVAILLAAAVPAHAGDLYLDVNGHSWHSKNTYTYRGQQGEYNGQNPGLGVTYGLGNHLEAFTGYFVNSFQRATVYGGAKIKHDLVFGKVTVTPGLNIGIATGYDKTPAQSDYYQFVIMPAVRIVYRDVGVTLGYVPKVEKENFDAVSTLTLQINVLISGGK